MFIYFTNPGKKTYSFSITPTAANLTICAPYTSVDSTIKFNLLP
jgi:hypothetical protein